jgi:hypothetical protein
MDGAGDSIVKVKKRVIWIDIGVYVEREKDPVMTDEDIEKELQNIAKLKAALEKKYDDAKELLAEWKNEVVKEVCDYEIDKIFIKTLECEYVELKRSWMGFGKVNGYKRVDEKKKNGMMKMMMDGVKMFKKKIFL